MFVWQKAFLALFIFVNTFYLKKAVGEILKKKNAYGLTPYLFPAGIFVWGDILIIGPFWIVVSLISFAGNSWNLFCLFFSVFWAVRSFGETNYWLNQQFSPLKRNPPEKLFGYRFFPDDSIWFVYQIVHQCITVFAVIASIYFAYQWLIQ